MSSTRRREQAGRIVGWGPFPLPGERDRLDHEREKRLAAIEKMREAPVAEAPNPATTRVGDDMDTAMATLSPGAKAFLKEFSESRSELRKVTAELRRATAPLVRSADVARRVAAIGKFAAAGRLQSPSGIEPVDLVMIKHEAGDGTFSDDDLLVTVQGTRVQVSQNEKAMFEFEVDEDTASEVLTGDQTAQSDFMRVVQEVLAKGESPSSSSSGQKTTSS